MKFQYKNGKNNNNRKVIRLNTFSSTNSKTVTVASASLFLHHTLFSVTLRCASLATPRITVSTLPRDDLFIIIIVKNNKVRQMARWPSLSCTSSGSTLTVSILFCASWFKDTTCLSRIDIFFAPTPISSS